MDEKKTAWERLKLVHTKGRPTIRDYIPLIFDEFYEKQNNQKMTDEQCEVVEEFIASIWGS